MRGVTVAVGLMLFAASSLAAAQQPETSHAASARAPRSVTRWWPRFAAGFATSILAHEGAHVAAAYLMGGRPTFGFDMGRPTVYSGIDAQREPGRQFVFSSAGLTTQTLIDEVVLDAPHDGAAAGPFERGVLAGGIATALFYVTIGRVGSVSDVDFMARTSSLSKTTISVIYGGAAALHGWRISRDQRYARFFVRPAERGGLRVGVTVQNR